jgi:hypothetical protein
MKARVRRLVGTGYGQRESATGTLIGSGLVLPEACALCSLPERYRRQMAVLSGVNHITFLTGDLDRLALFYEEVFGAKSVMELPIPEPEGPGRHALIAIGAANAETFERLRTDLLARGRRRRRDHGLRCDAGLDLYRSRRACR